MQVLLFPFERAFSVVAFETRDIFSAISSISELKTRNEQLVKENLDLRVDVASLEEIRQENTTLRQDFDLALREQYVLVAAQVIASDGSPQGNALVINQGTGAGVEVGMPVIVGKGLLIGRVSAVFIGSARVTLLSDPGSMVAVTATEHSAHGIVRGEYGLGILLDLVPRTDVLVRGENIVTSGLGGELPRGLFVGTLQDPEYTDDTLFQRAPVIPPVRYTDIRFVSVIVATKQP